MTAPTLPPPGNGFPSLPPLKPVFGLSLDDLYARDGTAVPMIVYQCFQAVELFGLDMEGIYRLSGSANHINHMKSLFDNGECHLVIYFNSPFLTSTQTRRKWISPTPRASTMMSTVLRDYSNSSSGTCPILYSPGSSTRTSSTQPVSGHAPASRVESDTAQVSMMTFNVGIHYTLSSITCQMHTTLL